MGEREGVMQYTATTCNERVSRADEEGGIWLGHARCWVVMEQLHVEKVCCKERKMDLTVEC